MPENINRDGSVKLLIFFVLIIAGILHAQDSSKIVFDEQSKKPMLLGVSGIEAYRDSNFSKWFDEEYSIYKVDLDDVECIREEVLNYDITIIMGTWCGDSRRETPRLIKILDTLNYPVDKVKFINVNRDKKDLSGEIDKLSVEFVPTFILFQKGKEIGRIVEVPEESLEIDLQKIIECTEKKESSYNK